MARNRKRAKERRARRADGPNGNQRIADDGAELAPNPIEHAAPDVELADAQLAVGRPDLADAGDAEEAEEEYELEAGDGGGGRRGRGGAVALPGGGEGRGGPVAEPRVGLLSRLVGFLQGSWRELQRVQWPDRRQVAQATGVVIGFVIVAGVFLGVADLAFSHLMNFILK